MADPGYKAELLESETEIVEPKMDKKALDTLCTKMSNFQGEFIKNADSLAWLLKLMAARDHQNSQARAVISAARKICISNTAFMAQTKLDRFALSPKPLLVLSAVFCFLISKAKPARSHMLTREN